MILLFFFSKLYNIFDQYWLLSNQFLGTVMVYSVFGSRSHILHDIKYLAIFFYHTNELL